LNAPIFRYLRSVIAIAIGLALGGALNLLLLQASAALLATPIYPDLLEPQHHLAQFLAHAISTFVGALVAFLIGTRFRTYIAYAIGAIFMFTGFVTGSGHGMPTGFLVVKLLGAYLPMCWLAIRTGQWLELSWHPMATTGQNFTRSLALARRKSSLHR
jgi:hypothetical protein